MNGLRFLSLLTIVITGASIMYVIIDTGDYQSILVNLEQGTAQTLTFTQKIKSYFTYADSWNYLILIAFIAILIFLFVLNDYLIGKYFQSKANNKSGKKSTSHSFVGGGLVWLFRMILSGVLVIVEFILFANIIILFYAHDKIVNYPEQIHAPQAVLLLGTNKQTQSGRDNLYYYSRIEAVVELYKARKISRIIISGDNSSSQYNEPKDMMMDLIRRGVPRKIIVLDYAGFRTLDSIVRLRVENNVNEVIIVSQKFHVERALFLSWFYNIRAKAYVAKGNMTLGMVKRELLAKPKVLMDLFLFNMQPKYGRTGVRPGVDFKKERDLIFIGTVFTLFLLSGVLLKNTFVY